MRCEPPSRQNIHRSDDLPNPISRQRIAPHTPRSSPEPSANPPKPTAPAANPTSRLRRSLRDTVTPPRNAPQNFAIIRRPLCESSMCHCRASRGRIGPSSAVPKPASNNPKCINPKDGAAALPRSTNRTPRKSTAIIMDTGVYPCPASRYFSSQSSLCSSAARELPPTTTVTPCATEDLHHSRQDRLRERRHSQTRWGRRSWLHGSHDDGLQAKKPHHRRRAPPG